MKKIVLIFGVFDGLHKGHEFFFRQSKELGDELWVVLTRDVNVVRQKKQAPKYNEEKRKQDIEVSGLVDKVILGKKDLSYNIVTEMKPDIIALGYDQIVDKEKLAKVFSGPIKRISAYKPEKYKSSKLNT